MTEAAAGPEPTRSLSRVVKIVASLGVIGAAAAYLLGGSLGRSVVYDRTVDQVISESKQLAGGRVRVGGLIASGSLETKTSPSEHEFALVGSRRNLVVRYRGSWPDAATEGRELMVDGVLLEDGTVRADRVLAKCPSRYKRRVTPR